MSLEEAVEAEIQIFLSESDSLNNHDKIILLRNMMSKLLHLNKADHTLHKSDLTNIISNAKTLFSNERGKVYIDNHKVMEQEVVSLRVIESTISTLNRLGVLKKMPKFKYTDSGLE